MSTKEKKAVKRLLKELGLFHIWIKNRKSYDRGNFNLRHFWQLPDNFARFIDESFTWSATKEEWLWEELYDNSYCQDYTPSEILHHNYMVEELKEICKSHL
jgi:hypothetical protein